jgi:membrane protein insertase Oxa1/YidC/SpoIIIJ
MINQKKLAQRMNKGSRLKEYPLLNLYILVAAVFEFIGNIAQVQMLTLLRPITILLMLLYVRFKSAPRSHLVPTLVQLAILFSFLHALAALADSPSNPLCTALAALAHMLYCLSLALGEEVRVLEEVGSRRVAYFGIVVATAASLNFIWQQLTHPIITVIYLLLLSFQLLLSLWRY